MLFWIFAVLALYLVQVFIPSPIRIAQVGISGYVGSRDELPDLPPLGARAERAARNLAESLPFFLAASILCIVLDAETPLALAGAAVFLAARIVYLLLYINAVPYIRSGAWTIGFVGILMMAWPLFAKLA
ncbi:MAG TPA: MAPEG family protein [Devosia sp.]